MTLTGVGAALRHAGLSPRALVAWAGTDRLSALRIRLPAPPKTRAGAPLALFVAGATVDGGDIPLELGELVDEVDGRLRARHAVLPHGPSLLVCDRRDAPRTPTLACWPDDSSYHLASAIPAGRRARWIDLGCGSAFAQLARPELASERIGVELNAHAAALGRLGGALSNVALDLRVGDIGSAASLPPADLVTCNAPIPDRGELLWRSTDDGFFARLFAVVPPLVAPGGLAVIHAVREAIPDELPGERAIVLYTPPGERGFCVMWWRPAAPTRVVERYRELTSARPHLDPADLESVLASPV